MSTVQYEAKRRILDLVEESARSGMLSKLGADGRGVQVKRDARPSDMEDRCIYAGGTREERPPEGLMEDGQSFVQQVAAYSSWFIRVRGETDAGSEPGKEIETLERIAEEIGAVFENIISENTQLAGPRTDTYVSAVQADHDWEDVTNGVILTYEVRTDALVQ